MSFTYNNLKAMECVRNAQSSLNEVSNYLYDFEEEKDDPEMIDLSIQLMQVERGLIRLHSTMMHILGSSDHEAKREEWRKQHEEK